MDEYSVAAIHHLGMVYNPYMLQSLYGAHAEGLTQTKTAPLNAGTNATRNTATVSPMNATATAAASNSATGVPPSHGAATARQQSGFAAALRKLAKQAEGPETSPIDPGVESTSPRETTTPKRPPQSLPKPLATVAAESSAPPPVVTIAPTVSKSAYLPADRNTADRPTNNLMLDPLGLKPERDKMTSSAHERGRDEERPRSKDSASMASRLTPHAAFPPVSSAGLHDDVTSRSGFQPYRPGDDATAALRHSLPLASLDAYTAYLAQAQAAAAAYTSSPYAPRMDDPLLLERYRLMQSSALAGYPYGHPGLMAHPGLSPYLAQSPRHHAEVLAQMGYPYLHPGAKIPELSPGAADRLKSEEERRIEREREEAREREKERERQREKEEKERAERERLEKERAQKEKERRLSSGGGAGGGVFSAERLLGSAAAAASLYGHAAALHEPLDLKRYDERARQHMHVNGERATDADRAQLPPSAHSYRGVEHSRSGTHSQMGGVAPLSVPKLASGHEQGAHAFHRPFEAPVSNGYDRQSVSEYERLVKERERMLAEHRLAQEKAQQQAQHKAQQQQQQQQQQADSRVRSERVHSGDGRGAHDGRGVSSEAQRTHAGLHEAKGAHYGGATTHTSQARRSLLQTAKPQSVESKHTPTKHQDVTHASVRSQDMPAAPVSATTTTTATAASTATSSSCHGGLSGLHTFPPCSPAITSLSNMINSDHLLAASRYDQGDKVKDAGSVRLNGAHASAAPPSSSSFSSSSRMRLQPESSSEKRKRLNSGEMGGASQSLGGGASKQKMSPKKHSRPVNLFPTKQERQHVTSERRDASYEPPAKRLHLPDDVDVTSSSRDPAPLASADALNMDPDYRQKAEFLFMLKLEAVPPDRRRENEFMQRVCVWDKERRARARLSPRPACTVDTLAVPYEYSTARMSQFITAFSSPLKRKHCASTLLQQSHQSAALTRSHDVNSQSKSVIQSTAMGQSPAVTAEFVQEFHESVLQQTRQQRLNKDHYSKSQQHSAEVRYSLSTGSPDGLPSSGHLLSQSASKSSSLTATQSSADSQSPLPSSLQSIQNMTSQLLGGVGGVHKLLASWPPPRGLVTSQGGGSSEAGDSDCGGDFRWPGVEAVMVAYHKHLQEERAEKQVLREQCEQLQQRHRQLTQTAQQLSRRMEELLQNKQKYDEERCKHQSKLDSLRRGLLSLR